ncbi:MAG TPA: prolyl oligopeptidase family serine peptidase [Blastocatellia bacterium]|nr:prolyl oligopeptidase family serine peptidase [Blastocatellia bacterium]
MTSTRIKYPPARKAGQVDDYHGVEIADPYRWLEDIDSEETREWIEAQRNLTASFLDPIPAREEIKQRLTRLWNFERYTVPFKQGDRYFYTKNDGLQDQNVLYTVESLEGEPVMLLDPNTLSKDGTVSLAGVSVSEDARLMAYGLSTSGSDWQEWRVLDIETGKDLEDSINWVKFSNISWTADGKGFFYSRYDEPKEEDRLAASNYFQKLFYHPIGADQSSDELVYERPDEKEWNFDGSVTEDGHYLIISVWTGSPKNRIFYKDLRAKDSEVVRLIDEFEAAYIFLGNDGPVFYFQTDWQAPRGRVIAIDTGRPERENWKELIPEAEEAIQGVSLVGDMFVVVYLKDARTEVKVHNLDGSFAREITLPGIGSASGFYGRRKHNETFYMFTGFTIPPTIYHYDMATGGSVIFREPKVDFNPDDYVTTQLFYASKDGTRVPMFITHRKGLKRDGSNPTYLYGYGGFNIPVTPAFSVGSLVWMEMGGVYAVANLRGGGEYGKEWHEAGTKERKQNVFDDFIAAAEWLIANGYTSTPRLAIGGGSNGGLLVGAVMNQRPDLFGAAVPAVGVMDMLRFHKFTIGYAWTSDYGSPDDPEGFKAIYPYSPLHNIKPGVAYPPTLIVTADHDDRVFPAHSFKYAAALQAAQAGPAPVLIRIESRAGHGVGTPVSKLIEETADRWAFLTWALNR